MLVAEVDFFFVFRFDFWDWGMGWGKMGRGSGEETYAIVHAHEDDTVVASSKETLRRIKRRLITNKEAATVDVDEHGCALTFASALENFNRHDDVEEEAVFALGQGGVADGDYLAVWYVRVRPVPG